LSVDSKIILTMTTGTPDERAEGEMYSPTAAGFNRRLQIFLCATVTLVVVVAAIRAGVCWWNARYLTPTNGVWLALATDLKDGLFYRPLLSPLGYGGTRYFPLFFILYALLLKLGVPVLLSGYLLSAAAIALLLVGTQCLMRRLGAEPWLAACSAGAVLAAGSVQLSLLSIHDDGLACALNICGLATISHPRLTRSRILLASILFTLAWSTKVTTAFGFAAAFLWLMFAGFSGKAWELAAETACGYFGVAAGMFFASHGRIVTIFKACAAAGTSPIRTLLGPFHLLSVAVRDDPGLLLFFFVALIILPNRSARSLPVLFFITTIAVTAFIFGSPGTSWNHLLDLQVASVIVIAAWLADKGPPVLKQVGTYSFALATLLAAIPVVHLLQAEDRIYPPRRFERAIALIGHAQKPILGENPLLPVLAGQRPYVMDPFMFRVVRQHIPNLADTLFEGLRKQEFSAVVLTKDAQTEAGRSWYQNDIFGPGFLAALSERYRVASVLDDQYIYLPMSALSPEAEADTSPRENSIREH
jgi:hypothetical protein